MKWYYVIGLVLCVGFIFRHKEDQSHFVNDIVYLRDEINLLEKHFNKEIQILCEEIEGVKAQVKDLE